MTPILETLFKITLALCFTAVFFFFIVPVTAEVIRARIQFCKNRKGHRAKRNLEIEKIREYSNLYQEPDNIHGAVFDQPTLKHYVTLMTLAIDDQECFDYVSAMAFARLHFLETEHRKTLISPMEFRPMMIHGLAFGTSMLNDVLRPIFQEIFLQTQGSENYQQSFNLHEYTEIKKHYEYSIKTIQENADHPILIELFTNVPFDPALNENRTLLQQLIYESEQVISELSEKIEIISALEGGVKCK